VVGDGGGSWKSFDPTDGVEVSSLGSSSDGASGVVVEGFPSMDGGVLGSATGGVKSLTEISSATPSSSMRKLNSPKSISKPPVLAATAPVRLETGSPIVVFGESMTTAETKLATLGDVVLETVDPVMSTMVADGVASTTVGTAMPTMVVDAVSTLMLALVSKLVVSKSMSMSIDDVESTAIADDEPSNLVGVERSAMVGEGAGKSIDPDPVVPTVGTN
jgi:hypothetical protein